MAVTELKILGVSIPLSPEGMITRNEVEQMFKDYTDAGDVARDDFDRLTGFEGGGVPADNTTWRRYRVIDPLRNNLIEGFLAVCTDNMWHVTNQLFESNCVIDEDGEITGHVDGQWNLLFRVYNHASANLANHSDLKKRVPIGTWGRWWLIGGSAFAEAVEGLEIYPELIAECRAAAQEARDAAQAVIEHPTNLLYLDMTSYGAVLVHYGDDNTQFSDGNISEEGKVTLTFNGI